MIAADVFTVAASVCAFIFVVVLALAVAFAWREDHDRTTIALRELRESRLVVEINGNVVHDATLAHVRLALAYGETAGGDGRTVLDDDLHVGGGIIGPHLTIKVIRP